MTPVLSREFSKYLIVPYVDKGRSRQGWDCFGLFRFVLQERLGVVVPSYADTYTSATADAEVAAAITAGKRAGWAAVAPGEVREGDGVVFTLGGQPQHCGYVIEPGIMLHTLRGRGTCIERYDAPQWQKRIEGFYRWNS